VLLIGLTPAGRAVADALAYNDIGYLVLEPDHDRFQLALADGYPVHSANPGDPRSWDALAMARRQVVVVVVATGNVAVSRERTRARPRRSSPQGLTQRRGRRRGGAFAKPNRSGARGFPCRP
jgi:S-adenosylhomocysteine hydrolase